MLRFLILLIVAALGNGLTPFEQCLEEETPPIEVRVSKCNSTPCRLVRGENVSVEVDFIPDHDVTNLEPRVKATMMGLIVNFKLKEQDACKSLIEKECPLAKDEKATYLMVLPIYKIYLPMNLQVELALVDTDREETVSCFRIKGKIV